MICCHRSFTRRKKENKEGGKERWKKKSDSIYDQYTNACTNWLQIEMDKLFRTYKLITTILASYILFHFLCS